MLRKQMNIVFLTQNLVKTSKFERCLESETDTHIIAIIGDHKSGKTSLACDLMRHPEINTTNWTVFCGSEACMNVWQEKRLRNTHVQMFHSNKLDQIKRHQLQYYDTITKEKEDPYVWVDYIRRGFIFDDISSLTEKDKELIESFCLANTKRYIQFNIIFTMSPNHPFTYLFPMICKILLLPCRQHNLDYLNDDYDFYRCSDRVDKIDIQHVIDHIVPLEQKTVLLLDIGFETIQIFDRNWNNEHAPSWYHCVTTFFHFPSFE